MNQGLTLKFLSQVIIFSFAAVVSLSASQAVAKSDISTKYSPINYQALDNKSADYPERLKTLILSELVLVEGGEFKMGSDAPGATKREKPVHDVELDSFYIGKTEVTQSLFQHIMGWNYSYFPCQHCAVNNISWKNVYQFFTKVNEITGLTLTFPTEAQWEFAAKGGNFSKGYVYSGSNNIDDVAWNANNANRRSQPVAQLKPNELGLYDMTGNLWEFVLDDMNRTFYSESEKKNPVYIRTTDPTKTTMKVLRGSGYEFAANESEVYRRDGATSNVRMPDLGFRIALNISPDQNRPK